MVSVQISSFKRTAEKRRGQLTAKRSSSASSTWVQGLPDIPGALKKSLWHKMHRRRRQQVVLRPSEDQVIDELKSIIRKQFQNAPTKGKDNKEAQSLERAEQLFLLAAHPASTNGKMLPITPSTTTNDPWGEPGWHLDLSVPKEAKPASRILPVIPQFPVFTKNLCEISSAPGRQAASILSASHLRALTSPLSAVAQAISLAETTPAISKTEGT